MSGFCDTDKSTMLFVSGLGLGLYPDLVLGTNNLPWSRDTDLRKLFPANASCTVSGVRNPDAGTPLAGDIGNIGGPRPTGNVWRSADGG